jgi:hypothetical protein
VRVHVDLAAKEAAGQRCRTSLDEKARTGRPAQQAGRRGVSSPDGLTGLNLCADEPSDACDQILATHVLTPINDPKKAM